MSPKSIVFAAAVAAGIASSAAAVERASPDLCPGCERESFTDPGTVGAATDGTVFAPGEVVSPVSTAHGATVVPVAMPVDLAGRQLSPALGAAQVALPDFYRSRGVPRASGGRGRYIPVGNGGLAFDNTLAVVPEPRVWALLIAGYAMVGFAMRRRGWTRRVAE